MYVHYHNLFCILFCSFEYGVVGWHDLYLAGWVARSILADKLIHTTMCCNCFCHILVKHAVFVFCCVQGRQALRRDRQPASHPASSPVSQSPATAAPSSQSAIHSAISQPASQPSGMSTLTTRNDNPISWGSLANFHIPISHHVRWPSEPPYEVIHDSSPNVIKFSKIHDSDSVDLYVLWCDCRCSVYWLFCWVCCSL